MHERLPGKSQEATATNPGPLSPARAEPQKLRDKVPELWVEGAGRLPSNGRGGNVFMELKDLG